MPAGRQEKFQRRAWPVEFLIDIISAGGNPLARTWRHGGNALEGGGGGDAEPCDAASIIDSRDFGGHPCSTTRDSHPARRNVLDRGRDGGHLERRTVYRDLAKPRARNRESGAIGRGASSRRRADIVAHHHRCFSTPTHLASIDAYHHQSMPPAPHLRATC